MTRMSGSAKEKLATLSSQQREALQLMLEQKSRRAQSIKPAPRTGGFLRNQLPTSYAQQRLWFIDQLESGSTAYHIAVALELKGDLDSVALERALNGLVRRHEILRTVFVNTPDGPETGHCGDG